MPDKPPTLSVVITAWNEAKNLPRVINSVSDLADEIIVVDTESTDDTVAIAKKLGARVYTHPNVSIVEPVRNFSISKATSEWILLLDADEEVSPSLAKHIKSVILANEADYCRIPRQNFIFGKWIRSSHWWPDYVYRLFKKGAVTWQEKIHSIPQTKGIGLDFPTTSQTSLIHHHYTSISQFLLRLDRYTTVQSGQANISSNIDWRIFIQRPAAEFMNQYYSRQGYKDGLHGLVLSFLQAVSEFVVCAKIWERHQFKEQTISPTEFQHSFHQVRHDLRWWSLTQQINDSPKTIKTLWLRFLRKI